MDEEDEEVQGLLAAILMDPDAVFIGDWSTSRKEFLFLTCLARMIERTICESACYQVDDALQGIDALVVSMRSQVIKRCEEHK